MLEDLTNQTHQLIQAIDIISGCCQVADRDDLRTATNVHDEIGTQMRLAFDKFKAIYEATNGEVEDETDFLLYFLEEQETQYSLSTLEALTDLYVSLRLIERGDFAANSDLSSIFNFLSSNSTFTSNLRHSIETNLQQIIDNHLIDAYGLDETSNAEICDDPYWGRIVGARASIKAAETDIIEPSILQFGIDIKMISAVSAIKDEIAFRAATFFEFEAYTPESFLNKKRILSDLLNSFSDLTDIITCNQTGVATVHKGRIVTPH